MLKLVDMGNRGDLASEQWERIKLLLPKNKDKTWTTRTRYRQFLDKARWRTVARYARAIWEVNNNLQPFSTLAQIWNLEQMFSELQTALDVENRFDWEVHFIDSTTVRAHQNAAGAKKVALN